MHLIESLLDVKDIFFAYKALQYGH